MFEEFNKVSAAQWKEQIAKDLKGTGFEALRSVNEAGISVQAFYTTEDQQHLRHPPVYAQANWEIVSGINEQDEKLANEKALKALNYGASALMITVYEHTRLSVLLNDISIEHIQVHFLLNTSQQNFTEKWKSFLTEKKLNSKNLDISITADPIMRFLKNGKWGKSEHEDLQELSVLISNEELWKRIALDATLYQNAGAHAALELALVLSHLHEYLLLAANSKIPAEKLPTKFQVNMAIGTDFFNEIAKFRSLRKLWASLTKEYGLTTELSILAESSQRNKSFLDAYNNMLRTTTESMSAAIGGCNGILVHPYDDNFRKASDFSERMAINQQSILKEEAYLNKVADIGAGSYYIEKLTEELCTAAWKKFQEIEQKGGWIKAAQGGYIQKELEKSAENLKHQLAEGKKVLLGVNKFPNQQEKLPVIENNQADKEESKSGIKPLRLAQAFENKQRAVSTNS